MTRTCLIGLTNSFPCMKDIQLFKIAWCHENNGIITVTCQDNIVIDKFVNALIYAHLSFYNMNMKTLQVQIPSQCFNEQMFNQFQTELLKVGILLCQSKIDTYNKIVIVNNQCFFMPYSLYTLQLAPWLRSCEWLAKNHKLYDVDNKNYVTHFAITEKVCKVDDYGIADWRNMQTMVDDMLADIDLQNSTEVIYYKLNE